MIRARKERPVVNRAFVDIDTGANNLQNFSLVASAEKASSGETTIKGTLDSTPSTLPKSKNTIFIPQVYTIRFFSNPRNEDEGKIFLGETQVTSDLSGKASFSFETAHPLTSGEKITATVTDPLGHTSEFSDLRSVTLAPGLG